MRRLALVTLVTMLALPGAASAATFSARVVHAGQHALTVRLPSGRLARYSSPQTSTPSRTRPLLAHAARDGITFDLAALEPGVAVLVTESRDGVTIALPGPGQAEQHATGVVTGVGPDSFVLRLADRTQLRLHGTGARACETVTVAYHQDVALLIADSVQVAHRAARCARVGSAGHVHHLARGTVVGSGHGTLTITDSATGRRETFATAAATSAGDHVVIVYHGRSVLDALYVA